MSRIPQTFIDDLLARTDIVEVIGSRVPLKKKGKEYTACCPFHHEKSPSFFVSPDKQFYHCFGCGAHGNALGFLMQHERLDFVEAIEALARQAGLDVPREGQSTPAEHPHAPLFDLLERCATLYQHELERSREAIAYLKQRGVSRQTAQRFALGYAPAGYDYVQRMLHADTALTEQLKLSGMLSEGEHGRLYDRFRQRIMFPIRDRRGRVIAFGGRVLNDDKPKYLNSPETPLFHKGDGLYGLYEVRKALGRPDRLLVVEGYMDVVMLAEHGIHEAVATLGTAVTREQAELMYRNTSQVIFCFDGDAAGRRAAWRALESSLAVLRDGLDARFLFLPEGEDPDSLVRREGAEAFRERMVREARSFDTFLFDELIQQSGHDDSPASRAKLKTLAQPLIQSMPQSTLRELMFAQLEQRVGARLHIPETASAPVRSVPKIKPRPSGTPRQSTLRQAITLLLHHPDLAAEHPVDPAWRHSDVPGYTLLGELAEYLRAYPTPLGVTLEHFRNSPHDSILNALAMQQPAKRAEQTDMARVIWVDMLQRLAADHARERLRILTSRPVSQLTAAEKNELLQLSVIQNSR